MADGENVRGIADGGIDKANSDGADGRSIADGGIDKANLEGENGRGKAEGGRDKADESTGEGKADGAADETQYLDNFFELLKKLVRVVLEIAQRANKEITRLKTEGIEAEYNAKDAYKDVLQVVSTANDYLAKVDVFFEDGEQVTARLVTVAKSDRRDKHDLFLEAMEQLSSLFSQNVPSYQHFKEACKIANNNSKKAGSEVAKKKVEVSNLKRTGIMKAAGKMMATTAVPTAAAFCTGTSIAFALPLAIAAGLGIGYGAYATAKDYNEVQKSFEELHQKFKVLELTIIQINTTIEDINCHLRSMADRITLTNAHVPAKKKIRLDSGSQTSTSENIEENEEDIADETNVTLVSMAERLHEKFEEGLTVIDSAKKEIKGKAQKLDEELETLYS